jgi:hypothetical protein
VEEGEEREKERERLSAELKRQMNISDFCGSGTGQWPGLKKQFSGLGNRSSGQS